MESTYLLALDSRQLRYRYQVMLEIGRKMRESERERVLCLAPWQLRRKCDQNVAVVGS